MKPEQESFQCEADRTPGLPFSDPEEPSEPDEIDPVLEQLLAIGKERGVTFEDVLQVLPKPEEDQERLENILDALVEEGVPLIEEELPEGEELEEPEEEPPAPEPEDAELHDPLGLYLKDVSGTPLLSQPEEVELVKRMEQGKTARETLAQRGRISQTERQRLTQAVKDGWAARDHLLRANLRLVVSVAKKYMGRGVPFLDLIQDGNIGLMRGAKKFEYQRGHKFSTYATWWIRQAVTRAIADQGRTIRLPVHTSDRINKLLRATNILTQTLGRAPTSEELAEYLGLKQKQVETMQMAAQRPLSLEMPIDEEEDSVLGEFVEDETSPSPSDEATQNLLREQLQDSFSELPPREVRILKLRYGLMDGQRYTLEEVGRKEGVTRERVRQIEAQALSRLRRPPHRRKLQGYLEK